MGSSNNSKFYGKEIKTPTEENQNLLMTSMSEGHEGLLWY
jgi:hypothetical protein